jgi:hypothetical protein
MAKQKQQEKQQKKKPARPTHFLAVRVSHSPSVTEALSQVRVGAPVKRIKDD